MVDMQKNNGTQAHASEVYEAMLHCFSLFFCLVSFTCERLVPLCYMCPPFMNMVYMNLLCHSRIQEVGFSSECMISNCFGFSGHSLNIFHSVALRNHFVELQCNLFRPSFSSLLKQLAKEKECIISQLTLICLH